MSILDDAIREHLELKRQHGADESELKRLEDEAFGPPGRPDQPDGLAEAPTEFMAAEATEVAESTGQAQEEARRRINIADLQEAPEQAPSQQEEPPESAEPEQAPQVEATESVAPDAESGPVAPAEDPAQAAPPAEEEPPETDETEDDRHAIAEQPTEFFDVEADMGTEDAPATEAPSPSDEEIVEAEASEPKLAPVEPATEIYASRTEAPGEAPAGEYDEDEEFWSDQRLSEELDQALEAPLTEEHDAPAPAAEPTAPLFEQGDAKGEGGEPGGDESESQGGHEDVLEDTPDFLEDAPEDDELWFEQRPPKDFDFDD
jgi:hypothetical protein